MSSINKKRNAEVAKIFLSTESSLVKKVNMVSVPLLVPFPTGVKDVVMYEKSK